MNQCGTLGIPAGTYRCEHCGHARSDILPEKDKLARATEVYDLIIAESARLGGVYSGEHGTGKRKRRDFLRCYGPEAVEQLRRCKAAVDPEFLLNRGNVVTSYVVKAEAV